MRKTLALTALRQAAGDLGSVRSQGPGYVIDLGGAGHHVQAVTARTGYPGDVMPLLAREPDPWPRHKVIVAHRLSSGSLEALRERGANWADEFGEARIVTGSGLALIRDLSGASRDERAGMRYGASSRRAAAMRWARSDVDIGEYLLLHPNDEIHIVDVAERTGWSMTQAAKVLRKFDHWDFTRKAGPPRGRTAYRTLGEPTVLLEAWSAGVAELRLTRIHAHALFDDALAYLRSELGPQLSSFGRWAASSWVALESYAPFVSTIPALVVYVHEDVLHDPRLKECLLEAGAVRRKTPGNVELRASTRALFTHCEAAEEGYLLASRPRVYADLMAMGGRAKDAALHLRETWLGT